jgi:hypothetical protein
MKMHFPIFAKMRKSCENGLILAKFRFVKRFGVCENFRFRDNFLANLMKISHFERIYVYCVVLLEFSCH